MDAQTALTYRFQHGGRESSIRSSHGLFTMTSVTRMRLSRAVLYGWHHQQAGGLLPRVPARRGRPLAHQRRSHGADHRPEGRGGDLRATPHRRLLSSSLRRLQQRDRVRLLPWEAHRRGARARRASCHVTKSTFFFLPSI